MNIYRCIHCGDVTGESESSLVAQELALRNRAHGSGVCTPMRMGNFAWCDQGQHWADPDTPMQKAQGGWACEQHQGMP